MNNKSTDFTPDFGNTGRKRPVKSFTLSKDTIKKLDEMQKFHPEINISNWVDNLINIALEDEVSPVVYTGYRKGFKPVTLMLRKELAEFINALLLTGGYGLSCPSKHITPLSVGEKITKAILTAPLFLAGDMEVRGGMSIELQQARDNANLMYKNWHVDFEE